MHESLRLYISPDSYHLIGESDSPETLRIDRHTQQLSLYPSALTPPKFEKDLQVYGLFGIIPLLQSNYLILITKRSKVTKILNTNVYTPTDFAVFPISAKNTNSLLKDDNEAYLLGLLKQHLFSAPFYYTLGPWDVTSRLQRQESVAKLDVGPGKGIWKRADERFFWNWYPVKPLRELTDSNTNQDCGRFILPIMFGFLNSHQTLLSSRPLSLILISRRSRHKAGTRYFSRGINEHGHVSNFNETEQLLLLNNHHPTTSSSSAIPPIVGSGYGSLVDGGGIGDIRFSFVQTRGSVPIYWAEINNLRYKPDLKILELSGSPESLKLHLDSQVNEYGTQYLINLVNQKGYELPIKNAFEKGLQGYTGDKVHYHYFDFHHECKGLRFDRVDKLVEGLDVELGEQGYFYHDVTTSPSRPQHFQTSVVRTNCMDCLDRTNVVQSALGKWVLNNQLRQAGVLSVKESIEEHENFLGLFRSLWADNADVVSRAYSGTGALKTDYTRTGKRTKEGALQDGVNSVVRYVKNNFLDGPRQDSYDLITGNWIPRKGVEVGWKRDDRDGITRAAPYALLFALTVSMLCLLTPAIIRNYFISIRKVLLLAFVIAVGSLIHIMANGIDYVAWPKLVVLDEILAYNGKGYESGRRGRPFKYSSSSVGGEAGPTLLETKKTPVVLKKERKDSVLPTSNSTTKRD